MATSLTDTIINFKYHISPPYKYRSNYSVKISKINSFIVTGQKFAMLEMKSTISNVLRNFELFPAVPEHKVVLKSAAVLKSYTGVVIGLKRRY